MSISSYGGSVQSIRVPDRLGRSVNVALGFATLGQYVANVSGSDGSASGSTHFGAVVGRYANRIAGRSFVLDGRRYELAGNDGPGNSITLHGGPGGGYSGRVWSPVPVAGGGPGATVRLRYADPDGANGFPGTVSNEVQYTVTGDNVLRIEYRARTDAATVVSRTSHTYFNLAGEGSGDVYDQLLAVNAHTVQPVSDVGIPTGFESVAGTPFDYRPGVQLYTSNYLVGDLVGTSGRAYRQGDAFALETQMHPDAPNHLGEPSWPDPVLRPGRLLVSRTTYRFTVAGAELAERIRF